MSVETTIITPSLADPSAYTTTTRLDEKRNENGSSYVTKD